MGSAFSACLGSDDELTNPKYRRISKNLIGNPTNFEHRSHFGNENLSSNDYKADIAKIKMATLSKSFDPSLIENPTTVLQNAIPIEQAQAQLFSRLEEFKKESAKANQMQESSQAPVIHQSISKTLPILPPLETQDPISEFNVTQPDLQQNTSLPISINDSEFFTQPLNLIDDQQNSDIKSSATDTLMPLEAEPDDTILYHNLDTRSSDLFDTVLSDISPITTDPTSTGETSKPLPLPPKN